MKTKEEVFYIISELLVLISIFLLAGALGILTISFGLVGLIKSLSLETIPASMSLGTYKFSIGLTLLSFLPFCVFFGLFAAIFVLRIFSERIKTSVKNKTPPLNSLDEITSNNLQYFVLLTLTTAAFLFLTNIIMDQGNVYINILLNKFI